MIFFVASNKDRKYPVIEKTTKEGSNDHETFKVLCEQ